MSQMDDPSNSIDITVCSKLYRNLAVTPPTNLYLIVGQTKSGKSTVVDLLSHKKMIAHRNQQLDLEIVVQQNNVQSQYPTIHTSWLNEPGNISFFMESLTVSQQNKNIDQNLIEIECLKQIVTVSKNMSIIVLVQEGQSNKLAFYLQEILKLLGIDSKEQEKATEQLVNHIYILLTKTEVQFDLKQFYELLNDTVIESENKNIQFLLKFIINQKRVEQFQNKEPLPQFANNLRDAFKPYKMTNFFKDYLSTINLNMQQNTSKTVQDKITTNAICMSQILNNLIAYEAQEPKRKQIFKKYEQLVKNIYPDQNEYASKLQIKKMVGQFNIKKHLNDTNLRKILGLEDERSIFNGFIQELIRLFNIMKEKIQNKNDYNDFIQNLAFYKKIVKWFDKNNLKNQIKQFTNSFRNCIKLTQTMVQKMQKKPIQKQKKIKDKKILPYNLFKSNIQEKCRTNRDVLNMCLQQLAKSTDQNQTETIYYLRLIRDLLRDFGQQNKRQFYFFFNQLLQLYLFNDNDYDLNKHISSYIQSNNISTKIIVEMIRKLQKRRKYNSCLKCIDYAIVNCFDDESFDIFMKIKARVTQQIHKQYKTRNVQSQSLQKKQKVKFELSITINDIESKQDSCNQLKIYLQGTHFRKYIGGN